MFDMGVDLISVEARRAVHVGDDQKSDKEGANAVGIDCWYVKSLWRHLDKHQLVVNIDYYLELKAN